jgi:chemotaxis protein histidine kinase CheA
MADDQPDEFEALLATMRVEFLATAAVRVDAIRREASGLAIAADPAAGLVRLVREAHTLKGGGATFGFASLGEAGGEVERIGKSLIQAGSPLPPIDALHAAVDDLARALADAQSA